MAIVVNHNLPAMNANRMLNINNNALSKSLEKLSSGLKINRAADDASGLSISEKMRAQVRGLDQASANSEDGVSLIQTADGALDTTEQMLQRMRELTVKGTTETLADEDLQAITDEMKTLAQGINQIAERTEFNTKKLLTGNLGQTTVKATANFTTDEATTVSGTNLTATAGKTVSAGTTVKLTSSYTTNATDSAVKIVAQDGDIKVKITSGASMTAGTTITDITSGVTLDKDVQLEYLAGGKHSISYTSTAASTVSKITITSGASLTTKSEVRFDKNVKVTSDTGKTITNSAKSTLTAGTTIVMLTANDTIVSAKSTIKAGATGADINIAAGGNLTAGTTFKAGGAATFTGKVVDENGTEIAAGTALTSGKIYKTIEDGTTAAAKVTVQLSAGGTMTRSAGATYDKTDSVNNYTVTVLKNCKTNQKTKTIISAGGTVTKTAGSSIAASNTVETLASTKFKFSADSTVMSADINVAAGGTVTVTAGQTVTSNDAKYSINTIHDGTTIDGSVTASVSLKEGESITVTAGRTLTAGTTFQLGVDKQFATDAKVSGDKLAISAGTAITAGTSYETNNDMVIQTGANAAQVTKFTIGNMAFSAITTNNTGADITKTDTTYGTAAVTYEQGACIVASAITTETACSQETLLALDVAINAVSTQRSKLGAVQNQLEYTIKNLDNTSENLSSAESRIRDTDMAKEMMNYTKYNILSQASQSMLAQANQQPQSVLSLLQ